MVGEVAHVKRVRKCDGEGGGVVPEGFSAGGGRRGNGLMWSPVVIAEVGDSRASPAPKRPSLHGLLHAKQNRLHSCNRHAWRCY